MHIKDILRKLLDIEKQYPTATARIDLEIMDLDKDEYKSFDFGYEEFNKLEKEQVRKIYTKN